MQRICFVLRVKPERIADYRDRHAAVWPEMLAALGNAGWKNYSLFLRADGLLIGYCETEEFAEAQRKMQSAPVNARWQSEMAEYFEDLSGSTADTSMLPLQEVFHLD